MPTSTCGPSIWLWGPRWPSPSILRPGDPAGVSQHAAYETEVTKTQQAISWARHAHPDLETACASGLDAIMLETLKPS